MRIFPVISFGKIINDYIDKKGLEHSEEVHKCLKRPFCYKFLLCSSGALSMETSGLEP